MKKQIIENYDYFGCGFRVILHNVPQSKICGEDCIDVDFAKIDCGILFALLHAPFKLTGEHIRFIRGMLHMNGLQFAKFLNKTHVTVLNWESFQDQSTSMPDDTENMLRLKVLSKFFGYQHIQEAFKTLEKPKAKKAEILEFNPFDSWNHKQA